MLRSKGTTNPQNWPDQCRGTRKWMGKTGAPVRRAIAPICERHGRSATDNRRHWKSDNIPAGNTTSAPPPRTHWKDRRQPRLLSFRLLRLCSRPTKIKRSRYSGTMAKRNTAMCVTSDLIDSITASSTIPSIKPLGWFATTMSGPLAGIDTRASPASSILTPSASRKRRENSPSWQGGS